MRRAATGSGSVYRRKDGRWEAAAYLTTTAGSRKRVRVYADTSTAARTRLADLLRRESQGLAVPERTWTVGDYLDYWLANVAPVSRQPKTVEMYEMVIRLHLKPYLGTRPLAQLSVSRLQLMVNQQLAAGRSVRSVQITRMVLSAALTRAMREELIVRNVARLVELPSWERKEISPWSDVEAGRFLRTAQSHPLYAAFLLLTLYGLRRGEALGLRWEDIDFEGRVLHVRQQVQRIGDRLVAGRLKTRASRRDLPLLPLVSRVLELHQTDQAKLGRAHELGELGDLVFRSSTGQPVDPKNICRTFHHLREQTGLRRITMHQLRHTAATLLKKHGVQPRDAQLILGHSNVVTTQQIYQHGDADAQRAGLAGVQRLLTEGSTKTYCRQLQPSNRSVVALLATFLSGGSSGTRTHDTLLKSHPKASIILSLTEVNQYESARRKQRLLGTAAVNLAADAAATSRGSL